MMDVFAYCARSPILLKIVSTGSCGGKGSVSTLAVNSWRSCVVTSPHIENRWLKISGIVCVSLFVPGVLRAHRYFGYIDVTSCWCKALSTPITSRKTLVSSICWSLNWVILYCVIPSSNCRCPGLFGQIYGAAFGIWVSYSLSVHTSPRRPSSPLPRSD